MLADLERARVSPVPANVALPARRRGDDDGPAGKEIPPNRDFKAITAGILLCVALYGSIKLQCALSLLAIAVQPVALYWAFRRFRLSRYVRECNMLRVFAAGFFVAILAASYEQVAQFVLARMMGFVSSDVALAAHSVSFGGPGRTTVRSVAGSLTFFVLLSYGTTALVEEVLKLGASRSQTQHQYADNEDEGSRHDDRKSRRQRVMVAVSLAVAGSCGFATIENIVYLIVPSVAQIFKGNSANSAGDKDGMIIFSHSEYWNMVLYRIMVVATLHVICGVLTGANVARRDLMHVAHKSTEHSTVLWCAVPAVILHGSYNLMVNLLHAEELHSHAHHTVTLWGVGALALAAGLLSTKVAGDALQNELRTTVAEQTGPSAATLPVPLEP